MKSKNDCIYCGGEVCEKSERLDYRYHGQLFIVENVPVGVCLQCGEKFLTSTVAKKLEKTVSKTAEPLRTVAIPIVSLAA